jgi:endo-1,4-beta-xylanase
MKKLPILLASSLLLGCASAPQPEQTAVSSEETAYDFVQAIPDVPAADTEPCTQAGTAEKFFYQTQNYDGDQAPETKYAMVYLPYGYDPAKQYDILYLMHGHSGNAEDWLGSQEEPSEIKYCMDHLIKDGMAPMIAVSATYYDQNTDEETDNYDIDLTASFVTEFTQDLMPQAESTYSTYADSTDEAGLIASRDHRMFGGFSMGAVTAWQIFLHAMRYVRYYYPASGSLYWSRQSASVSDVLASCVQDQGYDASSFFVYMTTGSEDFAEPIAERQIDDMLQLPDLYTFGDPNENDVNCAYGISEGEDHNYHGRLRDLHMILPLFSNRIHSEEHL